MTIHLNDTIVALATPPGVGALGVIRLSGPTALAIADAVFRGKQLSAQPAGTAHYGRVVRATGTDDQPEVVDEVVATVFRAPRSFTGEDTVELSGHGSPHILGQVLQVLVAAGARPARPGEFTQRAFLHGKLDLAQAEAVADLIAAESEAARKTALHQLRGGFSAALGALREELLHFSALIELELDFSEEDVEFADRRQLYDLLERIHTTSTRLIDSFRLGNALKNGVRVAILGAPNAGKSTLLNVLLQEERAIVSDIAGTTRDAIEATMTLGGIQYRFVDTAGIREETADVIERQGIARALQNADQADLIIYLVDATAALQPAGLPGWLQPHAEKVIVAYSKCDRLPEGDAADFEGAPGIFLSAKTGEGIVRLQETLGARVQAFKTAPGDTVVTNTRHLAALQGLAGAVAEVRAGLDSGLPGDLIALDLRRALHFIGEITGTVTAEDTLDAVFSKFCIGK